MRERIIMLLPRLYDVASRTGVDPKCGDCACLRASSPQACDAKADLRAPTTTFCGKVGSLVLNLQFSLPTRKSLKAVGTATLSEDVLIVTLPTFTYINFGAMRHIRATSTSTCRWPAWLGLVYQRSLRRRSLLEFQAFIACLPCLSHCTFLTLASYLPILVQSFSTLFSPARVFTPLLFCGALLKLFPPP
jgi:hypothetical protein